MTALSEMFYQLSYKVFGAEKVASLLEGLENINNQSNASISIINELHQHQYGCLQVGTVVPSPPLHSNDTEINFGYNNGSGDIIIFVINPITETPFRDESNDLTILVEGAEVVLTNPYESLYNNIIRSQLIFINHHGIFYM